MNELYQLILDSWVEECIYEFGHTLPMNTITHDGVGHTIPDDRQPLKGLSGKDVRKFILNYRRGEDNENTTIN